MISRLASGLLLTAAALSGAAASTPPAAPAVPATAIPRFAEVRPGLYRGGQPTAEGMKVLSQRGVKTIISLRPAEEWPSDNTRVEEAYARANGITLRRIPIPRYPTETEILEAHRLINSSPGPVFVHCLNGSERTGVVIGSYRIRYDGWTLDRALAEADKYDISFRENVHKDILRRFSASAPAAPAQGNTGKK